ncbi:hypothetical protein BH11PSE11_BH11PSE11_37200 [soil metagenome]
MKQVCVSFVLLCAPLIVAPSFAQSSAQASAPSATDVCQTGVYPAQWAWGSPVLKSRPASATSGTPRMEQVRNGVVIATYANLGGDAGYSLPNSQNGGDPSVGPFRRQPYTQWKSGDVFNIYPAIYNGAKMQLYIGPNFVNDAAYNAGQADVPANITIRGITVNGQRPVIVNPTTGASNSNYGQSLIYIDGQNSAGGTPSTNITIENIDVIDSPSGGGIGKAAVYINGAANMTLRDMRIAGFKQHNVNGVFATGNNSGTLLLDGVELDSNGGDDGPSHNAYINASSIDPSFTFKVVGSWSHDSQYGHELKSRAQKTIVEGSYLSGRRATAGTQTEAYLLDVPDGGTLEARNNIFVKGYSGNQSNGASLTFGVESQDPTRSWGLTVEHNTFVALSRYYDDANHTLYPMFINTQTPGAKLVDSNIFIGYCTSNNATKDFRGSNFAILGFGDIDLSFHPVIPQLTGRGAIVGTQSYEHAAGKTPRTSKALGARDGAAKAGFGRIYPALNVVLD